MTIVRPDRAGCARVNRCLDMGVPVVVPLPSPLPYVVVGTDPGAVNAAKGRPRSQPVGVRLASLAPVEAALELDHETVDLVHWLLYDQRVGVLAPVGPAAPAWLSPAAVNGRAFLAGAWLTELNGLMAGRSHVYMSSGNKTSDRPAVTVAEAQTIFGRDLLVVDGDQLRASVLEHGSSTMIAVDRGLEMSVVRAGINNLGFDDDLPGYLAFLRRRWSEDR